MPPHLGHHLPRPPGEEAAQGPRLGWGRVASSWGRSCLSPQERGGGVPTFQGALPVACNEVLGEQVMKPPPGLREAGPQA